METVHRLETDKNKLSARGGPETSAAAATNLRTGSQKYKLLREYAAVGSEGLTDEEAAIKAGLFAPTRQRRSSDLRNDGYIADTGGVRASLQSGEERMVCVITELGKGVLDASR
jgi:hypothetical protein